MKAGSGGGGSLTVSTEGTGARDWRVVGTEVGAYLVPVPVPTTFNPSLLPFAYSDPKPSILALSLTSSNPSVAVLASQNCSESISGCICRDTASLDSRGEPHPPQPPPSSARLGVEGGDKEGTAVFWHLVYSVQLLPLAALGGEERRGRVHEFPMGWGQTSALGCTL